MTNQEMDTKITEIEMLEAHIKSLKATVDSLKGDLKSELDSRTVDMIDTGINKIWYQVYSKNIVDNDKLKEDNLYDKYLKQQTVIQFKLTKSK